MIKTFLHSTGVILLICSLLIGLGAVMEMVHRLGTRTRVIDCSLAEFHPDFTTEMKEACRKARMNQK